MTHPPGCLSQVTLPGKSGAGISLGRCFWSSHALWGGQPQRSLPTEVGGFGRRRSPREDFADGAVFDFVIGRFGEWGRRGNVP